LLPIGHCAECRAACTSVLPTWRGRSEPLRGAVRGRASRIDKALTGSPRGVGCSARTSPEVARAARLPLCVDCELESRESPGAAGASKQSMSVRWPVLASLQSSAQAGVGRLAVGHLLTNH